MRKIEKIIIHCSVSHFGTVALIDKWHKSRGWNGCGYHFVITNGILTSRSKYKKHFDGIIQEGRIIEKAGAHTKGHNSDSIGICLIGNHHFTANQLYISLPELLLNLSLKYNIKSNKIYGHNYFNKKKTCPNISKEILYKITSKNDCLNLKRESHASNK